MALIPGTDVPSINGEVTYVSGSGFRFYEEGCVRMLCSGSVLDAAGRARVVGAAPTGSVCDGDPVLVAGTDSSGNVKVSLHDDQGVLYVRQHEEPTFVCVATDITIGNDKSMLSIHNAGVKIVRVREIWIVNVRTTSLVGVTGTFEMRRIKGHSGGTVVGNVESFDTVDVLGPDVTVRSGATITGESTSLLWRVRWSTDEWGPGSLDEEGVEHSFQNVLPVYYRKDLNVKPITLRNGQGLNIKHVVNSTSGVFDVFIVFTKG